MYRPDQQIAARFKEERERLGITIADCAITCFTIAPTIVEFENGRRSPNARVLHWFASAGADTQYILTGERRDQPSSEGGTVDTDVFFDLLTSALKMRDALRNRGLRPNTKTFSYSGNPGNASHG